jgi:hypothetical protein
MTKHAVSIPLLLICLVLIIALGILSFIKSDSKNWYIYILIFAAVEAFSIIYLAFL